MSAAMSQVLQLLDQLDTVELMELRRIYIPEAHAKAVLDESRTRPVRVRESQKTTYVEPDVIRREHGRAAVEAHAEGETD